MRVVFIIFILVVVGFSCQSNYQSLVENFHTIDYFRMHQFNQNLTPAGHFQKSILNKKLHTYIMDNMTSENKKSVVPNSTDDEIALLCLMSGSVKQDFIGNNSNLKIVKSIELTSKDFLSKRFETLAYLEELNIQQKSALVKSIVEVVKNYSWQSTGSTVNVSSIFNSNSNHFVYCMSNNASSNKFFWFALGEETVIFGLCNGSQIESSFLINRDLYQ